MNEIQCAGCSVCLDDPLPFKNYRIPFRDERGEIKFYLCWHCAGKLDDPTTDADIHAHLAYWEAVDTTAAGLLTEVDV